MYDVISGSRKGRGHYISHTLKITLYTLEAFRSRVLQALFAILPLELSIILSLKLPISVISMFAGLINQKAKN